MKTVKFTLSIGLAGAVQEDEREYDDDEVPTDPSELEDFLNEEWKDWSTNYIDGSATVVESE